MAYVLWRERHPPHAWDEFDTWLRSEPVARQDKGQADPVLAEALGIST